MTTNRRSRSLAIGRHLLFAALILCSAARAEDWTFVWVGATAQGWTVVQGKATARFDNSDLHFDLVASNAATYTVDAQVQKDGSAEVGLAGIGNAYQGLTILRGKFGKVAVGSGCKVEALQAQNALNSLSIGRFGATNCKP